MDDVLYEHTVLELISPSCYLSPCSRDLAKRPYEGTHEQFLYADQSAHIPTVPLLGCRLLRSDGAEFVDRPSVSGSNSDPTSLYFFADDSTSSGWGKLSEHPHRSDVGISNHSGYFLLSREEATQPDSWGRDCFILY